MQIQVVGIAWFETEADYIACMTVFTDHANFPKTYAAWLKKAEGILQLNERKGFRIVKANLRANDFVEWCAVRKLKIDSNGRKAFANWYAAEIARGVL